MPKQRIPFPPGITGVKDLPRTRQETRNCFPDREGRLISRPGIEFIVSTGTVARGQFVFNGFIYQVTGERLIKFTDAPSGTFIEIGTIAGITQVRVAIGFTFATIVVQGGATYKLSKTDMLTDITSATNMKPAVDVAHINNRFVFVPADGSPSFFSDGADPAIINAANFFDAEELPDRNNAVFNFGNTLYIAGTDSFERFRNLPGAGAVFTRIEGSRVLNGFVGALIEYHDSFLFIGREKDQNFGIYAVTQSTGSAQKISNETIDEILLTHTPAELDAAIGNRIRWRDHDIATFTLANESFAFVNGNWFFLDRIVNDFRVPWDGGFIVQFDGIYYAASGGQFGRIAAVNLEYSNEFTRSFDMFIEKETNDWFGVQSIGLGISQGLNSGPGSVGLATSRDNVGFGPVLNRDVGLTGQHAQHLVWNYPGGLGRFNGFMGVHIETTQDIIFTAGFLEADIGP